MAEIWVVIASPIIALSKVGRADLFLKPGRSMIVPEAVRDEIFRAGEQDPARANVYLNELDHFVKRTLGCRHYLRYMDDLVLLAGDPAMLLAWREQIRAYARARLLLDLRPDGNEPLPVHEAVTFVGWKTWWSHRVPRRQTLRNLNVRLANLERQLVLRPVSNGAACRIGMRQPARPTVKGWVPLRKYVSRAVRTGWIVADVREVGRIGSGCGDRAVVAVWFPTAHDGQVAPHGRGAA